MFYGRMYVQSWVLKRKGVFLHSYSFIISLLLAFLATSAFGLSGSVAVDGCNAKAVHQLGYTGAGIHVGLATSKNMLTTHNAFTDSNGIAHAFNHDVIGEGFVYDYHDTPFAGIIISNGDAGHLNEIGVAPGAFAHCARIVDNSSQVYENYVEDVFDELIISQGCEVIVAGVQFSPADVTPDGTSQWALMYDYYAYTYDVVFANAAGNYYDEVAVFGDAYNGITTGGLELTDPDTYKRVGNITNPGPTRDGRKKPEVVAPATNQVTPGYSSSTNGYWYTTSGSGATSWAVPHTAGVAALLLDFAKNSPYADTEMTHNVVIKAAIVNSVFPNIDDKVGNNTDPADANNTWHSERGYGRLDAAGAVETLAGERIFESNVNVVTSSSGWGYDTADNSEMHTYKFSGTKNHRLIFTVTWNRKARKLGGSYYNETSPKFNIDVNVRNSADYVVYSESGEPDNLEKFDLLLPADDIYIVELINTSNKSRAYGLAFEMRGPLAGDLNIDYAVDVFDLDYISDNWLTGSGSDKIDMVDVALAFGNWMAVDDMYYNE